MPIRPRSTPTEDPAYDALLAAISGPARVTIDGNTTELPSISDLIAANRYLRALQARVSSRGFSLSQFVPPGSI
jgi:hypothetical protein